MSATNQADVQTVVTTIRAALISRECWESAAAFTQQYRFDGQGGFKYSGFDTQVGSIRVQSVGRYAQLPALVWETWDSELVVLLSNSSFATYNIANGVITQYIPGTHGCF